MNMITYIDDYINDGKKDPRSMENIYETMLMSSTNNPSHIYRTAIDDFFLRHKMELDQILNTYTLDETMFYKPKAVSLKEYGTTEFWLAILRANNMKSIVEFHKPVIYMYDPDSLILLIKTFFKREGKM